MKKYFLLLGMLLFLCRASFAEDPASSQPNLSPCSLIILESGEGGTVTPLASIVGLSSRAQQFLTELWKINRPLFKSGEMNQFGPDSKFQEIDFVCGKESLVVRSWHRLVEQDQSLVVTSHGAMRLDGMTREQIMFKDEPWYRDFKKAFDAIFIQGTSFKE